MEKPESLEEKIARLEAELHGARAIIALYDKQQKELFLPFMKDLMEVAKPRQGAVTRTIWYMWKEGEDRAYAYTTQPAQAWVALQRENGFNLVSFELSLPDSAELNLGVVGLLPRPMHLVPL